VSPKFNALRINVSLRMS